eukprot:TRINITY_DN1412_c0_g1_i5.p1 TRINITY_DN1412_c0_g1~~TRINITY_DN1412_c0_g1_i5.p1  ORF type:complete len:302 (+),score=33.76 TRINITY_DN1412_c0_g1_i5:514-1419(+)
MTQLIFLHTSSKTWRTFQCAAKSSRQEKKKWEGPKKQVLKISNFGNDPSLLEMETDAANGYRVPRVLMTLKRTLVKLNGLQQTGIFRLAGQEQKMKQIMEEIDGGVTVACSVEPKDVHTVASLLKRWFDTLKPHRLLSYLPSDQPLEEFAASEEAALKLPDALPDLQRQMLLWLLDLLVQVALNREANKMAPKNLAIVVGPPLLDFPKDNPILGLQITAKVTTVLLYILNHKLASAPAPSQNPTQIPPIANRRGGSGRRTRLMTNTSRPPGLDKNLYSVKQPTIQTQFSPAYPKSEAFSKS